jgi:hypothetical protein
LRLWIKARACLPLLLYEFAKTGQDKFAVLFNLFVGDVAERIEKYSSGPFVCLGGFCVLADSAALELIRVGGRIESPKGR